MSTDGHSTTDSEAAPPPRTGLTLPRPTRIRLSSRTPSATDQESGETSSLYGGGRRRAATAAAEMQHPAPIREETATESSAQGTVRDRMAGRRRAISNAVAARLGFGGAEPEDAEASRVARERALYDRQVIDLLDVMDPEVSTLTTLSDLQNSLFVPNLGRFVNRDSYLRLSKPPTVAEVIEQEDGKEKPSRLPWRRKRQEKLPTVPEAAEKPEEPEEPGERPSAIQARGQYLVLPQGLVDWDHWTDQEREELDDYVRHLMHSRKWKARRMMRGFGHYVRTPLGAFITIYASLLTLFGTAWVLFLIGWINTGERQDYFVEIIDQILVALFCMVGLGMAPFRAVDSYHMYYITKYHSKTIRLYREQGFPPLPDENDLPDPTARPGPNQGDRTRPPVLTVEEQATFLYHQGRFAKSHTFARFHETQTHRAFPFGILMAVVILLDFHSCFQLALGSTTWSISYHHHFKRILTSIILSFSLSCNITAGFLILGGNRKSRKKEVIEELFRRSLTEEAVRRKAKKKEEERVAAEAQHERHRQDSLPPLDPKHKSTSFTDSLRQKVSPS